MILPLLTQLAGSNIAGERKACTEQAAGRMDGIAYVLVATLASGAWRLSIVYAVLFRSKAWPGNRCHT